MFTPAPCNQYIEPPQILFFNVSNCIWYCIYCKFHIVWYYWQEICSWIILRNNTMWYHAVCFSFDENARFAVSHDIICRDNSLGIYHANLKSSTRFPFFAYWWFKIRFLLRSTLPNIVSRSTILGRPDNSWFYEDKNWYVETFRT